MGRTFLNILTNWHSLEFRRLRWNIVGVLVILGVFVIPGALLGYIGFTPKLIWLELGMVVAVVMTFRFVRNRAVIAAELSTAANAVFGPGGRGSLGTVAAGVEEYIRFVGALFASELAILLFTLFIPAHRSFFLSLLLLPASLVLVALWISQGGELLWLKIVRWSSYLTIGLVLLALAFPQTLIALMERAGGIDALAVHALTESPLRFLLWAVGALLVLAGIAAKMTGKPMFVTVIKSLVVGGILLFIIDHLAFQGGWAGLDGKFPFGKSTEVVCETDTDRPLPQVVHLLGPKRAAYVKFPRKSNGVAGYNISRDEVEGDLVIDFADGSRDTWSPGEPRRDGHWKSIPRRLYGRGTATVTIFPKKCEEVTTTKK